MLMFGIGMQILTNAIQRNTKSSRLRMIDSRMNAQMVMIGMLKPHIHLMPGKPAEPWPSMMSLGSFFRRKSASDAGTMNDTFGLMDFRKSGVISGSGIGTGGAPLESNHGAIMKGWL